MALWALPIDKCLLQGGSNHVTCFIQGKVICTRTRQFILILAISHNWSEKKTVFEPVTSNWIGYYLLQLDQQRTWKQVCVGTGSTQLSPETQQFIFRIKQWKSWTMVTFNNVSPNCGDVNCPIYRNLGLIS